MRSGEDQWDPVQPNATILDAPVGLGWDAAGHMLGVTKHGRLMIRSSISAPWELVDDGSEIQIRHVSLPYGKDRGLVGRGNKKESQLLGVDMHGTLFQKRDVDVESPWRQISHEGEAIGLHDVSMGTGGRLFGLGKHGCLYMQKAPSPVIITVPLSLSRNTP